VIIYAYISQRHTLKTTLLQTFHQTVWRNEWEALVCIDKMAGSLEKGWIRIAHSPTCLWWCWWRRATTDRINSEIHPHNAIKEHSTVWRQGLYILHDSLYQLVIASWNRIQLQNLTSHSRHQIYTTFHGTDACIIAGVHKSREPGRKGV